MPNFLCSRVLTGSGTDGRLGDDDPESTCLDWTSDDEDVGGGALRCGHAWPRSLNGGGRPGRPGGGGRDDGSHWIQDHPLRGCAPGVNLVQNGAGTGDCVGCNGGYGGFYCFALAP